MGLKLGLASKENNAGCLRTLLRRTFVPEIDEVKRE
jgi:hypothetical protein